MSTTLSNETLARIRREAADMHVAEGMVPSLSQLKMAQDIVKRRGDEWAEAVCGRQPQVVNRVRIVLLADAAEDVESLTDVSTLLRPGDPGVPTDN